MYKKTTMRLDPCRNTLCYKFKRFELFEENIWIPNKEVGLEKGIRGIRKAEVCFI